MFSQNQRAQDFILTNIAIYIFAMAVWSFWSYFAFVNLEKRWIGREVWFTFLMVLGFWAYVFWVKISCLP